jgi:hypothetical protein
MSLIRNNLSEVGVEVGPDGSARRMASCCRANVSGLRSCLNADPLEGFDRRAESRGRTFTPGRDLR